MQIFKNLKICKLEILLVSSMFDKKYLSFLYEHFTQRLFSWTDLEGKILVYFE